jgi:hypothetical protein
MLFFLSSFIDGYIPLKNIFTKKATFFMTRPYIKSMINDIPIFGQPPEEWSALQKNHFAGEVE